MDLRLVPLRVFIAVAEERSFSAAARRLKVAQAWVSVKIRDLETHVGVELLTRSHNPKSRAELTPAGRQLLQSAMELVKASDSFATLSEQLRGEPATLRFGSEAFAFAAPFKEKVVSEFCRNFPHVKLEILNLTRDYLQPSLLSGHIDVGLISGPDPSGAGIESLLLQVMPVELVIPQEHRLAQRDVVPISEMRGETVLVSPSTGHPMAASVKEYWELHGVKVIESRETNNAWASIRQAQELRCFAQLGAQPVINASKLYDDMVQRPIEGNPIEVQFWLFKARRSSAHALKQFWDYVKRMKENESMDVGISNNTLA